MQMILPRDRRLLALALAVCVFGCSFTVDRHPVLDATVCGPYPSTIGKYLKVGTSADEVLEHVGPPNTRTKEDNQVYYVYRIQPFPGRRLAGGLCYSKPIDGSSSYEVAFGPDKTIDSVAYHQLDETDTDHVDAPELLAEQGSVVVAVSICGWNGVGVNDGISGSKDAARRHGGCESVSAQGTGPFVMRGRTF
jgi:outer membrane protein assembly factor BamE (lipoprotein component of BamABCDE complex)